MAAQRELTDTERILEVTARRFPQSEFAIRQLLKRSEAFRDMCEELSEAELALANVSNLALALRETRRAEWQELVDRLVNEVGAALSKSEFRKSTDPQPTRTAEE